MRPTLILLAGCWLAGLAGAAAPASVTIAAVNNPAMIELKKLSAKFEAAQSQHQTQLGGGGRKCAAPARDHRHLDRQRPV